MGPRWLAYRVSYAARLRLGQIQRRLPTTEWAAQPLPGFLRDQALAEPERYLDYRRSSSPSFFFAPGDREQYQPYFADWDEDGNTPLDWSDEIAQGNLRYFQHETVQAGFPPDWHGNPFTGQTVPADLHWSQIHDFGHGDIRIIWEPSRFGFAYTLARAFWRSGEERYAEMFWQLVEDWRTHNPPQRGPNWKCGQETSFRVMAWCFGLYAFLHAEATSPERVAALAQMIAISGQRVEANLNYALSQRNNHGISEGVGLWTIGMLFPELHEAEKWRELGHHILETQGRELIYDDGAFSQHSVNYQRLMLYDYLWALRLGELHDHPFSTELKEQIARAGTFLFQLQDEGSGQVPNYGHNDGSLILPLNNCDFRDFRPVIQATQYLSSGKRCYQSGPWDEDLLWLFGPVACEATIEATQRLDLNSETGGYYTLRSKTGFAFVRCATFQDRPAQADMLHLDLWWRGQNIALDPGTYSYNSPSPWNHALGHTAYHNTVTVDGLDQMERAGKFLWLPWLRSKVQCSQQSSSGFMTYWEGEHDGYHRLKAPVRHRRGILRVGDDCWFVLDALSSTEEHQYLLHWLFADVPYQWDMDKSSLLLQTPAGTYHAKIRASIADATSSLLQADKTSPRGWQSQYYNNRVPALSVVHTAQAKSVVFCTSFGADVCEIQLDEDELRVKTDHWYGLIRLQKNDNDRQLIVASVSLDGAVKDQLELSG
jgi:asparagine synthase (glutamine-hydrolysing)